MSIKIHHGPDGTYKTSGAIKDDILKIVKTGRTLVTNVRGFSRERTVEVLGEDKVHKDFKVIHIDTDASEGRAQLARFFHWSPKGAYFVIDEVQRIFPPKWTEKDLRALDYPDSQDHLPENERRPETIHVAFDMQRHHNWDFVFTTTNVKKVHEVARIMAKVAVRHVNLGIWRFYKTIEHDAETNGKTAGSATSSNLFNYVPSYVFDLYSSTSTGLHNNTEPRKQFYKDPKIAGLLLILVCFWGWLLSKSSFKEDDKKQSNQESVQVDKKTDPMGNKKADIQTNDTNSSGAGSRLSGKSDLKKDPPKTYIEQFDEIYFSGYSKTANDITLVFSAFKRGVEYQFSSDVLASLGAKFTFYSECLVELSTLNSKIFVLCTPSAVSTPLKTPDEKFTPPTA